MFKQENEYLFFESCFQTNCEQHLFETHNLRKERGGHERCPGCINRDVCNCKINVALLVRKTFKYGYGSAGNITRCHLHTNLPFFIYNKNCDKKPEKESYIEC
jgi:hypothetical protein